MAHGPREPALIICITASIASAPALALVLQLHSEWALRRRRSYHLPYVYFGILPERSRYAFAFLLY